ncbi:hypothetical protein GIB67_038005 [Kingdonia uniflora]|uniref:Uncharacterized protein n=1 Tax=Kingdonia uniflora TaxID=39325 RepID=A0A7J7LHC8_9MAGN|nr:hypothetical protein GIB67_038005 [Kingdonia uniflora]
MMSDVKGQFYNNKAREADEKSAQKTLECRKSEAQDEVTIDVHDQDAKGAIRLLKSHLTSLADQCLKVIVQTDAEDTSKRSLKRLVLKLLEKESIRWTEEGNGGTILINVEDINPQQLSFYKSY